MGIKIEIHSVDDWEAIYVDGERRGQDHSDQLERFLEKHFHSRSFGPPMTIDTISWFYHEGDDVAEYVLEGGGFPDTLKDLEMIKVNGKKNQLAELEAELAEKKSEVKRLKEEIEKAKSS